MDREEIKVAVLRIEGTNCEMETVNAFRELGVYSEAIHLKQFYSDMIKDEEQRSMADYNCLVFPGGFSAGDYVRAGAIFSARLKSVLTDDLRDFIGHGYPVLGICNGFQILAELGALPGVDEDNPVGKPHMAIGVNDSNKFECRPTLLKHENRGKCAFTHKLDKDKVMFPVAHAEGKVMFPMGEEEDYIDQLRQNDQIVFRYVDSDEEYASYPWNPNGSIYNIAGICNTKGNVFGLMPHPERVFWDHRADSNGDGRYIFESAINYLMSL